jgi:holo-[acyl-carrier protein] synthase
VVKGIGCDIVEITRIKQLYKKSGSKFLIKILSPEEIKNLPKHFEKQVAYITNRFAAKEAFAKAMGTGIGETFAFTDITVSNEDSGKPFIKVTKPGVLARNMEIHLTLSDEKKYSVAFVLVQLKE